MCVYARVYVCAPCIAATIAAAAASALHQIAVVFRVRHGYEMGWGWGWGRCKRRVGRRKTMEKSRVRDEDNRRGREGGGWPNNQEEERKIG